MDERNKTLGPIDSNSTNELIVLMNSLTLTLI